MVNIFNRRELIITFSMDEQARIRGVLAANQIDYTVKTGNRTNPLVPSPTSRSRTGSFGVNQDAVYEYKIYVKREDYDRALHLIRK